jgi:hypothetical protein
MILKVLKYNYMYMYLILAKMIKHVGTNLLFPMLKYMINIS